MAIPTTQRIVAAASAGGKTIALELANGNLKTVDVSALLNGPVFAVIASDDEAFAQLFFDPELGTVCWPGDIDLAPETLADLPDLGGAHSRDPATGAAD